MSNQNVSRSELDLLKEWYWYNSFVRDKYLEAIFEKIPEEKRYEDRGASFPALVDIFIHVIDAYTMWFVFAYEDRLSEFKRLRGSKPRYSRQELEVEVKKLQTMLNNFLNNLSEADLGQFFVFRRRDGSGFRQVRLRDMLWHMVEEELQHRGELNAIFWQLDVDPPVTGWNPWDEDKEAISEDEYLRAKQRKK